jgi:hypothetical protein
VPNVGTSAPPTPSSLMAGPPQWGTPQLLSWLRDVKTDVNKRGDVFEKKGWTKEELTKWRSELEASFAAAAAKLESSKLTGQQIAKWDLTSDKPFGEHLGVTNAYHRAAIWSSWKQLLRMFS